MSRVHPTERGECDVCGKIIAGRVPNMGDGTVLRLRRHKAKRPHPGVCNSYDTDTPWCDGREGKRVR